jgi:tetratricopeptide (TPR) repeat protein
VARDCYEQCLRICREVGNRQGEGWALNDLGVLAGLEEHDASQRECYEQTLGIFRELGDQRGESFVLINLGFISATQGDAAAAQLHLERGLRICREIGYQWGEGVTLGKLGLLAHLQGDDYEANARSQEALRILREIGARPEEGYALLYLGHARLGLGQPVAAAEAYRAALDLRRALDQPHLAAEALAGLARVALASADLVAARAHVEEILLFLQHDTLAGADEPLRVYLTCYQTLRAMGDTRSAQVLEIAHLMLRRRAAKLPDETVRLAFLDNVAAHQVIAAEFANQAYTIG